MCFEICSNMANIAITKNLLRLLIMVYIIKIDSKVEPVSNKL